MRYLLFTLLLCQFHCLKSQLVDEKNITLSMELQPVLNLEISGMQDIEFIFDEVSDYSAGITKYAATQLKVNSSLGWDLYAVGFSSQGTIWDQQLVYGSSASPNAINQIPCSVLELRQDKQNPFPGSANNFSDYSSAFQLSPVSTGANNIYTSADPFIPPSDGEKYIAGGHNTVPSAVVPGGSYLIDDGSSSGASSNYWYSIDYRIVPGLPATFPNAASNNGLSEAFVSPAYAQAGVYTMSVKFILVEN